MGAGMHTVITTAVDEGRSARAPGPHPPGATDGGSTASGRQPELRVRSTVEDGTASRPPIGHHREPGAPGRGGTDREAAGATVYTPTNLAAAHRNGRRAP